MTIEVLRPNSVSADLTGSDVAQVNTATFNAISGRTWLPYLSQFPALYLGEINDFGLVTAIANASKIYISNEGLPGSFPGNNLNGTEVYIYTGNITSGPESVTYVTGTGWSLTTDATITNVPIKVVNDEYMIFVREDVLPSIPEQGNCYILKQDTNVTFNFASRDSALYLSPVDKTDIDTRLNTGSTLISDIKMVSDITERDALVLTASRLVLALDATGDPDVMSGGAIYFWNAVTSVYTKVYETEGIDVVPEYSDINGLPTSSVATIDDLVSIGTHVHGNTEIDGMSESGAGNLLYNNKELTPGVELEMEAW